MTKNLTWMQDIEKHIKSLLIVENTVSLPGIGGFIKKYKEADVSELKKNISPPLKTVSFNKYLGDQNEVLLKRVMEQEKLNEQEARQKMEEYIASLKEKLDKEGEAGIEGVGKLKKTSAGEVIFESALPDEELADNFGLSLLEIDVQEQTAEKKETPQKPVMGQQSVHPKKRNYTPLLVTAIVIVLLAPVVYFLIVKTNLFEGTAKSNLMEDVEKEVEQIEREQQAYADSIDQVLEQKLNDLTQKGTALSPGSKDDDYYDQFERFYIVAGSFKNYERAGILKNELIQKGFKDADIVSSNGFYRVTITSYTDRKLALQRLNELRRDYNSNVWVLSI